VHDIASASGGTDLASRTTSVALIEDQQILAGAIQRSLSMTEDLDVVGCAPSLASGLELVAEVQPDVLVSDYRLSDGDVPGRPRRGGRPGTTPPRSPGASSRSSSCSPTGSAPSGSPTGSSCR